MFNVGANVRFAILDTTARVYFKVWQMAAFAGFLCAKEAARCMLSHGYAQPATGRVLLLACLAKDATNSAFLLESPMLWAGAHSAGTILFTGATASTRGAPGYAAFSGAKAALRALAQVQYRHRVVVLSEVNWVIERREGSDSCIRRQSSGTYLTCTSVHISGDGEGAGATRYTCRARGDRRAHGRRVRALAVARAHAPQGVLRPSGPCSTPWWVIVSAADGVGAGAAPVKKGRI